MSVRCRTRMVDLRLHNIERATPFWTWFLFPAAPLCWTSEAIGTRPLADRPMPAWCRRSDAFPVARFDPRDLSQRTGRLHSMPSCRLSRCGVLGACCWLPAPAGKADDAAPADGNLGCPPIIARARSARQGRIRTQPSRGQERQPGERQLRELSPGGLTTLPSRSAPSPPRRPPVTALRTRRAPRSGGTALRSR
jgi:hypothetical protein